MIKPSTQTRRKKHKRPLAKKQRRDATEAEMRLWSRLRRRQVAGGRFRRQHPIGPYVVDFCCLEEMLVVEVDGGQHSLDAHVAYDQSRTSWLEREGYTVVRFWNHQVLAETDSVVETIAVAIEDGRGRRKAAAKQAGEEP